jgi:hypothetical protein
MRWLGRRAGGSYAFLMLPLGYLALPGVFPAWMWAGATILHVAVLAAVAALIGEAVLRARRRTDAQPSMGPRGQH